MCSHARVEQAAYDIAAVFERLFGDVHAAGSKERKRHNFVDVDTFILYFRKVAERMR